MEHAFMIGDTPLRMLVNNEIAFHLNLFWERVFMWSALTRTQLVWDVATDEVFSRRMFPRGATASAAGCA